MSPIFDVVVVGAGPYGLSTAAHLLGRGLRVAVFGRTLEMWRDRMPKGMLLRSHWWATNLSDPRRDYGFEQFAKDSSHSRGYPLPIQTFITMASGSSNGRFLTSMKRTSHRSSARTAGSSSRWRMGARWRVRRS